MLELIVAYSKSGVIGKDNQLLWKLKDDLLNFKNITKNSTIVMGRKTFESIGKPLPERKNIILSKNKKYQKKGCIVINSIDEIIELSKNERVVIIGGEQIYNIFKDKVNIVHLTIVNCEIEGDAYFSYSEEELKDFKLLKEKEQKMNERNEYSWVYYRYEKK